MGNLYKKVMDALNPDYIRCIESMVDSDSKDELKEKLMEAIKILTPVVINWYEQPSDEEVEDLRNILIINGLLHERRFNLQIKQAETGIIWAETIIKEWDNFHAFQVGKLMECDTCGETYPASIDSSGNCNTCDKTSIDIRMKRSELGYI